MIDTLIALPFWVKLCIILILINLLWSGARLLDSRQKMTKLKKDEETLNAAYEELIKASEMQKEALMAQLKDLEGLNLSDDDASKDMPKETPNPPKK